jgi:hypothetical protein
MFLTNLQFFADMLARSMQKISKKDEFDSFVSQRMNLGGTGCSLQLSVACEQTPHVLLQK